MRAIRYHRHGGPEVLALEEVPDPVPVDGELLVETRAIAVSPIDWKVAKGAATAKSGPLPQIPGGEAAGVLPDGRRVVLAGGGHGTTRPGVYAERFVAPAAALVDVPDGVDLGEAASLGVAYATAYLALEARAALRPGEKVVVLGATGGVGTAGVQVARLLGAARVVAMCRAEAAEAVRALGPDAIVDVASADLGAALREATDGGADVILDPVGGEPAVRALAALAPWGRQVALGTSAGDEYRFPITTLYGRNASLLGFTLFGFADRRAEAVRTLLAAIADGRLRVPIGRRFPLAEAADAWRHASARGRDGKVLLVP